MVGLTPILGWSATIVLSINMIPQVIETYWKQSSADLSYTFIALNLLACMLFMWWGSRIEEGQAEVIVSNAVVALCDIALLASKFLFKKEDNSLEKETNVGL